MSGKLKTDPLKPAKDAPLEASTGWTGDGQGETSSSRDVDNLSWSQIQNELKEGKFAISGSGADSRKFDYDRAPNAPSEPNDFRFRYLGAGSNKHAIQIEGTRWVLLCGNPVRTNQTYFDDFDKEVKTLVRLGTAGVPVPKPFGGSAKPKVFHINLFFSGNEKRVPAFLQEYLPVTSTDFAEMPKAENARDNFAKTDILGGGTLPKTIWKTVDDLNTIAAAMSSAPWNDFQLMYNRSSGRVIVFDPMPFPDVTPEDEIGRVRDRNLNTIDIWLDDIDGATQKDIKRWRAEKATKA